MTPARAPQPTVSWQNITVTLPVYLQGMKGPGKQPPNQENRHVGDQSVKEKRNDL